MKILQKSQNKIVFVEEIDESLANAIRRSCLEIPVLAIDEVEISKNDSVLYDEVLALRLGLVPLENQNLELKEECSCKGRGCNNCTIQLKLKAKGPCTVYSGDLKGSVKPIYPDMPLTSLEEDAELELVAFARLGKGIQHTKYSPGLVFYRNVAELKIEDMTEEEAKKCSEACPKKVLKIEKNKVVLEDKYKCDLCGLCGDVCESIKIIPGKEILFTIESYGQLQAKDILSEAVKALKKNLKEFT